MLIKLTQYSDGGACFVRPDAIVSIQRIWSGAKQTGYTSIKLGPEKSFLSVLESPAEIAALCNPQDDEREKYLKLVVDAEGERTNNLWKLVDGKPLPEDAGVLLLTIEKMLKAQDATQKAIPAAREALEEARQTFGRESLDPSTLPCLNVDEERAIAIAERQGYGRLMQLLSSRWFHKTGSGAFAVGTCFGLAQSAVRKIDAALAAIKEVSR